MTTNYPGSIDSYTRLTETSEMDDAGLEGDTVVNNLYDAVEAVEGELGTNPSGSYATVAARLDAMGGGSVDELQVVLIAQTYG